MRLTPAGLSAGLSALLGSLLGWLLLAAAPPAAAEDVPCLDAGQAGTAPTTAESVSAPLVAMQVAQARARLERSGTVPGGGVTVAVLGSGVAATSGLEVAASPRLPGVTVQPEVVDPRSTIVAGLVAGPTRSGVPASGDVEGAGLVGIAPAARLVSLRAWDAPPPQDDATVPTAGGLLAGLRYVADAPGLDVDVVVVPDPVPQVDSEADALTAVAQRLRGQGVVVVAATGDLPATDSPLRSQVFDGDRLRPGLDAAPLVWPASLPGVVGVGSPEGVGLPSSATTVAAPSAGAVSVSTNGGTCVIADPSTAWAAGEVAGVVALLRSAFPDEDPATTVARLRRTATGAGSPTRVTGDGVVQPLEALRRPLPVRRDGDLVGSTFVGDRSVERAERPEPPADVLATTRRDAVWWGLLGVGALVVAMVLRPVLTRRSR